MRRTDSRARPSYWVVVLRDREAKPVGFYSRHYGADINWTPARNSAHRYSDAAEAADLVRDLSVSFRLLGRDLRECGYSISVEGAGDSQ